MKNSNLEGLTRLCDEWTAQQERVDTLTQTFADRWKEYRLRARAADECAFPEECARAKRWADQGEADADRARRRLDRAKVKVACLRTELDKALAEFRDLVAAGKAHTVRIPTLARRDEWETLNDARGW